jgi:hypothetical protein
VIIGDSESNQWQGGKVGTVVPNSIKPPHLRSQIVSKHSIPIFSPLQFTFCLPSSIVVSTSLYLPSTFFVVAPQSRFL